MRSPLAQAEPLLLSAVRRSRSATAFINALLMEEKTVIMIAHRLKTVERADQILVVDHGRIVQRGTHTELMNEDGIYRDFISERREAASWRVKA